MGAWTKRRRFIKRNKKHSKRKHSKHQRNNKHSKHKGFIIIIIIIIFDGADYDGFEGADYDGFIIEGTDYDGCGASDVIILEWGGNFWSGVIWEWGGFNRSGFFNLTGALRLPRFVISSVSLVTLWP